PRDRSKDNLLPPYITRASRMNSFGKLVVGSALPWAAGSGSASYVNISLDLAWQSDDSACSVPHSILQYPADIAAFSDVSPDAPCNLTLRPSLFGVLLTLPHSHYACSFPGNPKIRT